MIKILTSVIFSFTLFANTQRNDVPARFQWFTNSGYCGETSLISAGLYYGQYLSQFDARAIASKDGSQTNDALLIGVNDKKAAQKMHLAYEEWDTDSQENTDQFFIWLKQKIAAGNPVAIGVYANQYLFYMNTDPDAGDPDYDHIVSAMYLESSHPLSDPSYYPDDVLGFNDNGYWENQNTPTYFFSYGFEIFPADRKTANSPTGPVYSLSNDGSNYGIAITGVKDLNGDTLPVRVDTNVNFENPPIADGSNTRPASMQIVLTVTISDLEPGTSYILYRYNNLAAVPESRFNANGSSAYEKWMFTAQGTTYVHTETIQSNESAIYRCVKSTAP
ncbi:MAG: hypothetical protein K1X28_07915 [Parachlamydiales bacterium]|nr:hypothetical protein [Parachlamydiales bacterium]